MRIDFLAVFRYLQQLVSSDTSDELLKFVVHRSLLVLRRYTASYPEAMSFFINYDSELDFTAVCEFIDAYVSARCAGMCPDSLYSAKLDLTSYYRTQFYD